MSHKNKHHHNWKRDRSYPRQHRKPDSKHLWKQHKRGWWVLVILLFFSTMMVKDSAMYLQSSLLTSDQHDPFDGTVYPIQEVPDWLASSAEEGDMSFTDFPGSKLTEIPSYNPSRLRADFDDLEWGDTYDDYTRQMKITYTVPYAGNYEFDGVQGAGSHPGIDIVALEGTPVYSIMNGVVERVTYSGSGFGNLIVVRHNNVPDPDDKSQRTTLYSGYAHLSNIRVSEGDVVEKGQKIGNVGDTGTATTPHLHFQVDNDDAPWHLYWPFTTAEANEVGGFWEAINVGLNQSNVYKYTENPLDYVQKYLDPDAVPEEDDSLVVDVEVSDIVEPAAPTDDEDDDGPSVSSDSDRNYYEFPFDALELEYDDFMLIKDESEIKVSLVDERGELVKHPSFNSPIEVSVEDSKVLDVFPLELKSNKFGDGSTEVVITAKSSGASTITFEAFDKTYTTEPITVLSQYDSKLDAFLIETDGQFFSGQAETVSVVALNKTGDRIANFELDEPVRLSFKEGEGEFSRDVLTIEDFENGTATVSFIASSEDNVILKAESGLIKGKSDSLTPSLFRDIQESDDYYTAISYLKSIGVISGYDDGTFQPDRTVSRVEALKLLFAGFDMNLVEHVRLTFPDTDSNTWYAPYVATAQDVGVVNGYPDGTFQPAKGVNRVEFIKMLTGTLGIDVDPVVTDEPYGDVHRLDWFAPYAQFVKDTNIDPWNSRNLEPGESMTRGEVAEMIYRVLVLQANDAEKYRSSLEI